MLRFEIKKDGLKHKVVDLVSGHELTPDCDIDMASYHAYLKGKGLHHEAHTLLKEIAEGKRPITNMIEKANDESLASLKR
jgi:hypothetical protein